MGYGENMGIGQRVLYHAEKDARQSPELVIVQPHPVEEQNVRLTAVLIQNMENVIIAHVVSKKAIRRNSC